MKLSMRIVLATTSTLLVLCAMPGFAQAPRFPKNTGVFEGVTAPLSPTLRFWASDAGKDLLLHSPNPAAPALLHWFHPEAESQYPQEPLLKPGPVASPRVSQAAQERFWQPGSNIVFQPFATVTGCGTSVGTVMNLEPVTNAVGQYQPQVDFLLSALGSGLDLVAEYGFDARYFGGTFDSADAMYVHRDATQPCYGGTDFEMGNPPIADPFYSIPMNGGGGGRILADPGTSLRPAQFILADLRFDALTSGIGLRRIAKSNLTSTTTCPAGTLTRTQEATCAGTNGIIVDASQDNIEDTPAIAQDPRSSGTGAGDIYVVAASRRVLRTVILITACKGAFATASDCSAPVVLNVPMGDVNASMPSVAVVGGGPNAGAIVISYIAAEGGSFQFVSCTPGGAPVAPTCGSSSLIYNDSANLYTNLTGNVGLQFTTWPVITARTDTSGQTLFVVWSDCRPGSYTVSSCPYAEVQMVTATTLSNPSWAFQHVNASSGHHFLPSVAYDSGQNIVNIAYYSTGSSRYKNQEIMNLSQVPSGSITPGSPVNMTTTYDSLQGDGSGDADLYYGTESLLDYVGVAAHGGTGSGSSRVYLGFTNDFRNGTYGGVYNTQADNNVSRATY